MQFGKRLAIVVVGSSVFWTSAVHAQHVHRTAQPQRSAHTGRSAGNGGFWQGQVRSFKQRWGLSQPTQTVSRPPRPVSRPAARPAHVMNAAYHQTAARPPVHPAAYQAYGQVAPAMPGYPPAAAVVAPTRPEPKNPATAGLVPGYPQFQGPLYPCPVPGVPDEIGGTMITNQAFAPHEMLYPHEYRALYPPFYYKVHGGWIVTPWGVWSSDRWELQGTEVKVKYKSYISPLTGFMPPVNVWRDEEAYAEKWY